MKRLLQTALLFLISYGIMTFVTLEWNVMIWESYQRVCMLLIFVFSLLIKTIIDTADFTLNNESTRNDELLESHYENMIRKIKNKKYYGQQTKTSK